MCSEKTLRSAETATGDASGAPARPEPAFIRALTPVRIIVVTLLAVAAGIALGWAKGELGHAFSEGEFITWVSVLLLVLISVMNFRLYGLRRGAAGLKLSNPAVIWAFIGAGFAFLALDDAFLIHENLDKYGHVLLGIEETPLTDRADDLLIGLYGLIGLAVLWLYRGELMRYRRFMPYLVIGFGLLFLQVGLDAMTNGKEYLRLFRDAPLGRNLIHDLFKIAEEAVKLLAEAMFLSGFVLMHRAEAAAQLG